jgi:hypothetical protein
MPGRCETAVGSENVKRSMAHSGFSSAIGVLHLHGNQFTCLKPAPSDLHGFSCQIAGLIGQDSRRSIFSEYPKVGNNNNEWESNDSKQKQTAQKTPEFHEDRPFLPVACCRWNSSALVLLVLEVFEARLSFTSYRSVKPSHMKQKSPFFVTLVTILGCDRRHLTAVMKI